MGNVVPQPKMQMFQNKICTMLYTVLYKTAPNSRFDVTECKCSAQSKNRCNSGIVLRKVGILTLSTNSGIVPDNSRIVQGIYCENT